MITVESGFTNNVISNSKRSAMKRVGKYFRRINGDMKTYYYVPKRHIPKESRKVLVFGATGVGKNYNLISEAIRDNENVLYISSLPAADEFKNMPTAGTIEIYENCTDILPEFSGKVAYDYGQVPQAYQEVYLWEELLPYLEESGMTKRADLTIIFDNVIWLMKSEVLVNLISGWNCKVVFDWTCDRWAVMYGDLDHFFNKRKISKVGRNLDGWILIPVFTRLYKKTITE